MKYEKMNQLFVTAAPHYWIKAAIMARDPAKPARGPALYGQTGGKIPALCHNPDWTNPTNSSEVLE